MNTIYIAGQAYSHTYLFLYCVCSVGCIGAFALLVDYACNRSSYSRRPLPELPPWTPRSKEELEKENRKHQLAVFNSERKHLSDRAVCKLAVFQRKLEDYRTQLDKLRAMDAEHEAQCWVKYRIEPATGLEFYLDEPRANLTEPEKILTDLYQEVLQAKDSLFDTLDSFYLHIASLIRFRKHSTSLVQNIYHSMENEYGENQRKLQPLQQLLHQLSINASMVWQDASTISKWRAAQNQRRHSQG